MRARLSVERPGGLQHTMEAIDGFVNGLASETIIGHHPEKFVPYLTVLGLFILICNLIGLVPGLESPTGVPIVPLGCALLDVVLLQLPWRAREWAGGIPEALYRAARGHAAGRPGDLADPFVPD